MARLARAIRDSVIIAGAYATNRSRLLECLKPDCADSGPGIWNLSREAAVAAAAIEVYEAELGKDVRQFYACAERGRPQVSAEVGKNVELLLPGQRCSLTVFRTGPQQYQIKDSQTTIEASIERADRFEYWLTVLGRRFHILVVADGLRYGSKWTVFPTRLSGDEGILRAPAPAVVVSVAVKVGDRVEAGDRLAVLEAMKLEMDVKAEFAGWVRQVMIIPNVQVDTGAVVIAGRTPGWVRGEYSGIEGLRRSFRPKRRFTAPLAHRFTGTETPDAWLRRGCWGYPAAVRTVERKCPE